MGVLSINLGPEGLKKDGIPSIDGVLTSLDSSPVSNSGLSLVICNMSRSRGLGASMLQFVGVFNVCGWTLCSF